RVARFLTCSTRRCTLPPSTLEEDRTMRRVNQTPTASPPGNEPPLASPPGSRVGIFATLFFATTALAADHRDGPAALVDPTTDITDLFAWVSDSQPSLYLVMDLQGGATGATAGTKFSDSALYVFHLTSGTRYGNATMSDTIVCSFGPEATQT